MAATLAASILSDPSSDMYQKLLKEEVINSSFTSEIFSGDGYFSMIFSGESSQPEKIRSAIIEEIALLRDNGLEERAFQRNKKSVYGMLVRELNNVANVANLMINSHMDMDGASPYASIETLSELTAGDVADFIKNELLEERLVMSVIEGRQS